MNKSERMILVSFHIPRQMLRELDELVKRGIFPSRSEAIRVAIRNLIEKEKQRRDTVEKYRELIIGR